MVNHIFVPLSVINISAIVHSNKEKIKISDVFLAEDFRFKNFVSSRCLFFSNRLRTSSTLFVDFVSTLRFSLLKQSW